MTNVEKLKVIKKLVYDNAPNIKYDTSFGERSIINCYEYDGRFFIEVGLCEFDGSFSEVDVIEIINDEYDFLLSKIKKSIDIIRNERKSLMKKYNVTDLYHFTNVKNLQRIIESGAIFSKEILDLLYDDDIQKTLRLDNCPDFVCTSVGFTNYKLLFRKRFENPNEEYIVFRIDPSILLDKLSCLFAKKDASAAPICFDLRNRYLNHYFDEMFINNSKNDELEGLGMPFDSTAEVLIKDAIDLSYIRDVNYNGGLIKYKEECYKLCREVNLPFIYEPDLFKSRNTVVKKRNIK